MRILQVGLGSMGKRRLRNLAALGETDVIAFDLREDRRAFAAETFGVRTVESLDDSVLANRDAIIISTPPDHHLPYIELAIEKGIPAFVEASIISEGLPELAAKARERGVLLCPSCTMRFHASIRAIKAIVASGDYGRVTSFNYYMGQYLPDWHPWEDISEFYVGRRETSATREMVPFEMTWLVDLVGRPTEVTGLLGSTLDMGVDIDDTYAIALRGDGWIGNVTVDVVARYALRQLVLNLERAQIMWRWDTKEIQLFDAETKQWRRIEEPVAIQAAAGYNPNITEQMYIDEMDAFRDAVIGARPFPNTMSDDIAVLAILEAVESAGPGVDLR